MTTSSLLVVVVVADVVIVVVVIDVIYDSSGRKSGEYRHLRWTNGQTGTTFYRDA